MYAKWVSSDPTLTVNVIGDGTVTSDKPTGNIINCTATGGGGCSRTYPLVSGSAQTVTLTPALGTNSVSVTWGSNCGTNGVITMDSDKTCTVIFNPKVDGCFADSSINKNLNI